MQSPSQKQAEEVQDAIDTSSQVHAIRARLAEIQTEQSELLIQASLDAYLRTEGIQL